MKEEILRNSDIVGIRTPIHSGAGRMRSHHSATVAHAYHLEKSLRRKNRRKSSNRLYCDAGRLLESKMTSFARSTIDRLATIIAKRMNKDELLRFLSTEEGFRSSQVWRSCVFDRCTLCILLFVSTTAMTCHQ